MNHSLVRSATILISILFLFLAFYFIGVAPDQRYGGFFVLVAIFCQMMLIEQNTRHRLL